MQPCIELSRLIVQLSRIPLVAVCALHTAEPLIKEVCKFVLSSYKGRLKANIVLSLNVCEKKKAKKKPTPFPILNRGIAQRLYLHVHARRFHFHVSQGE